MSVSGAPSAACSLPASITLRTNAKLPDPFAFYNGTRVVSKNDWLCRRDEIGKLFQRLELGILEAKPPGVSGSLSGNTLTVNVTNGSKKISFNVPITYPSGAGLFPAIITVGGSSISAPSGVAVIRYSNDEIAQQIDQNSRGKGKFYDLTAGAMIAWTWGISRLSALGVTGCSRNGKGAMIVGAFEPRGSGGAACWRISQAMKDRGMQVETAYNTATGTAWLAKGFEQYMNRTRDLPHDHYLLAAMVAPRGLLILEHSAIDWLGPESTFGALGVVDRMAIVQVGAPYDHCQFPASQRPAIETFIGRFLTQSTSNATIIVQTDKANNVGFVEADWVDWAVPTLAS
ncbi:Glucuronoyl esterase catalytic domain from Hypocrea Jecorina [Ephemerocybe angulata]|uniref:(4-O-methyl)-D-glucuronate--lignin esterase n=1 Tax=Ephemerocybe angulata TaxID=980116 RepID=A0A8H6M5L6_9AGAR|nr:Glucuronoyl esterase catalytic domain from Hypocrea Jecorina [Tulosesus angulatus]